MAQVRLTVRPYYAHLLGWGKAADGWYCLIWWHEQTHDNRVPGRSYRGAIFCTGWMAADLVQPLDHEDYSKTPKVALPSDPQLWPARMPTDKTSDHDTFYLAHRWSDG